MKTLLPVFSLFLLLSGCAGMESQITIGAGPYLEWLSTCKDYRDVQNWFVAVNYEYDTPRLRERFESSRSSVNPPWTTFARKKGICTDTAVFSKYSLNNINPDYRAEILFLDKPGRNDHYVCVFHVDGKLYVMDYGTPKSKGLYGPFDELSDFIAFYRDAKGVKVSHYFYGWPASKSEPW